MVDLRDVVQQALTDTVPALLVGCQTFSLSLGDLPLHVMADRINLSRALTFVILNATHHSARSERLTITAGGTCDAALVWIADNRLSSSLAATKRLNPSGVCAGATVPDDLSVVSLIARQHGGSFSCVFCEDREGVEFCLRLPRLGAGVSLPARARRHRTVWTPVSPGELD